MNKQLQIMNNTIQTIYKQSQLMIKYLQIISKLL